jgi:DNA-binding CsgD family transcriptional regulator
METLSHSDILDLNNAIGEIYSSRDMESFYSVLFHSIKKLVPCEHCSFNDIRPNPTRFIQIIPASQDHEHVIKQNIVVLNNYLHEHPLLLHYNSDNVVKTTDIASKDHFKTTTLYNEFYRHLETETQILFSVPLSYEIVFFVVMSRHNRDFSERDRLILTLLKPHCVNALRNVTEQSRLTLERDLLRKGAEAQRQGAVLCNQDGIIIGVSELAREFCSKYFGVDISEDSSLPEAFVRWFASEACAGILQMCPERVERECFIVEKDGKLLTIKLLNDVTSDDFLLCMNESDPTTLFQSIQQYGLSPRETEVVHWLAKGKTNIEIAVILKISRRTTEKHLEHIFAKLGVETRIAAVAVLQNERNLN